MLRECWSALGGDPAAVGELEVADAGAWLGGPLAVDDLAVAAAGAALLAAAELAEARGLGRPSVALSAEHVALPGCGHVPCHDDPKAVAAVLLAGSREAG